VAAKTADFLAAAGALRHAGGGALVELHGPRDLTARGAAVAFNLRAPCGRRIPYWEVEGRARAAGVALRGGCFCNPGAAEVALGLDPERTGRCLAELDLAFSPERFAACSGGAVGAVRVSFGMATNDDDVARAVAVLASYCDLPAPN
jgi:selenocysteine lyase/cysteine desulfurase